MKVLVSAYACEPGRGSEPGVGWSWVRELARFHEVWVITRGNNRGHIEQALKSEGVPSVHWIYFDLPRWARLWKNKRTGLRTYYVLWHAAAYFLARKLCARTNIDIIHHVTFGTYWLPTFLPWLGIPFVWGPVGGGESTPHELLPAFSWYGRLYEFARDVVRSSCDLNPFTRYAVRRALLILCKNEDTKLRLQRLGATRLCVCSEVGFHSGELSDLNSIPCRDEDALRLVSVGRLIHWKGFELALRAFVRLQRRFPASEYWLIGDGPERHRLEALARGMGVYERVHFWGNLPRSEALEKIGQSDVLVHPSLHDSGGWACLEAMAAARPVICLNLGGPGYQVTDETGFKVEARSPDQVIDDLAAAMTRLADDRSLCKSLGRQGRQRVAQFFSWDNKRRELEGLYESDRALHTRARSKEPARSCSA